MPEPTREKILADDPELGLYLTGCRKIRFQTAGAAAQALKRRIKSPTAGNDRKRAKRMKVYLCRCGYYHLGH